MLRIFFKFLIAMTCTGALLLPSSASAQTCSAGPFVNAVGDTITFTATLHTSDPNENGEGEPLTISSSGGEVNSPPIPYYESNIPFSFTATKPNETINGSISGFDGDETCEIGNVFVNGASALPVAVKKVANTAGVGLGLLGIGAGVAFGLLACAPPFTPLCLGLLLGGGGGAASGLLLTNYYPADPSDSNYTTIAQPIIPSFSPITVGGTVNRAQADAFNSLIANQAAIVGVTNAAVTSANRAQGALDAGNTVWQIRQKQAAQLYTVTLGGLLRRQVTLLGSLRNAIGNSISIPITPSNVFAFEWNILTYGLPAPLSQTLGMYGLTSSQISETTKLLAVQDINVASGRFPDILTAPQVIGPLQNAASVLSGVPVILKPGDLNPAINPRSAGTTTVALLSTNSFDATKVDVATVHFGPNGAIIVPSASTQDVNHDGKPDLILKFNTSDTGIQCGDSMAALTGQTTDKTPFFGGGAFRTTCSL